jgi:replicative DNA helicase
MSAQPISNIEGEAALLGAMMMSAGLIDQAAERVSAEHFAEPLHGRIFAAILAQHSAGKPATPVSLRPLFEKDESIRLRSGDNWGNGLC